MSEEMKSLILWILAFFVGLLTSVGGWIFKQIFGKLKELEDRIFKHELDVQSKFSEIKKELELNAERDTNNYENTMMSLKRLNEGQEKMSNQMDVIGNHLTKLHLMNPDLKNPELKD